MFPYKDCGRTYRPPRLHDRLAGCQSWSRSIPLLTPVSLYYVDTWLIPHQLLSHARADPQYLILRHEVSVNTKHGNHPQNRFDKTFLFLERYYVVQTSNSLLFPLVYFFLRTHLLVIILDILLYSNLLIL